MDKLKAYRYLKAYKETELDDGVNVLMCLLQNKYGYSFNKNEKKTKLIDLIFEKYKGKNENFLKLFFVRPYIWKAFHNRISHNVLLNKIKLHLNKFKENPNEEDAYEITHYIIANMLIGIKDKELCKKALNVIDETLYFSDVKLEAKFLLIELGEYVTLTDHDKKALKTQQKENGGYIHEKGNRTMNAHKTCFCLLIQEYFDIKKRNLIVLTLLVTLFIFLYIATSNLSSFLP